MESGSTRDDEAGKCKVLKITRERGREIGVYGLEKLSKNNGARNEYQI